VESDEEQRELHFQKRQKIGVQGVRVCLESEILEFLQFDELEFRRRPPSVTLDHSLTVRLHTPRVNTSSEYSLTQEHTYDIEIDGRGLSETDGHGPPCGGALAEAVVRTIIVFFLQISPNALATDWWRKVVIASTRDRWAPRGTRHTTCMRSSCSIAIEHELEYGSVRSNRCPQQSSSGGQRDHG
jgi:hypothetical protein